MERLSVLTYHSIDDTGSVISVSPTLFDQHLRFLKENEFDVIGLADGLQLLKQGASLNKKIVLTFDDGYENFYSHSFPALKKFGFPSTVFLVTEYCGRNNNWPGQGKVPIQRLMSWSQIVELSRQSVEFGSHSQNHPYLTRIPIVQSEKEIMDSRKAIEDHIGKQVRYFAYPYGVSNVKIHELVKSVYQAAAGTNLAQVSQEDDLYDFSRVDVYYVAQHFNLLVKKSLTSYLKVRNLARRIRNNL